MAEGRSKSLWGHTSAILCLLANVNRDPKKRSEPFRPSDFDPHAKKVETPKHKYKMSEVKAILMGTMKPRDR